MALPYRPYPIGLRNINNWEAVACACTRVSAYEQERKRETVFKIIMFFFRAKLARPVWRRKTKVVDFMCLFLVIKFFLIFFRLCLSLPCCPCPILTLFDYPGQTETSVFSVFGCFWFCPVLFLPLHAWRAVCSSF